MEIAEFIPSYPDVAFPEFMNIISAKNEFIDDSDTIFFKHQKNIARFLSPKTLYNSILLIHEMGTGKTATAIATIELIRRQDARFSKIIVLANGKTQLNVFRQEIFDRVPTLLEKYSKTNIERNTILKREGYIFDTYRVFAKDIMGLSETLLKQRFENTIFIMDEVHNLTSSKTVTETAESGVSNSKAYRVLHRLLHILKNRKLLCMTGTPIRDQPFEIAKLLNLVLPLKTQLETGQSFINKYFKITKEVKLLGDVVYPIYDWKMGEKEDFQSIVKGYTSYLKKELPKELVVDYMRNPELKIPLEHFAVYGHAMSETQSLLYFQNFAKDLETATVGEEASVSSLAYFRSKQASLFVFPSDDEEGDTIGKQVAEDHIKYVYKVTDKSKLSGIAWKSKMRTLFPTSLSIKERLDRVKQYSAIYSFVINEILRNPSELVYLYSFLKSGSGIYILVSLLTQYFNFELVTSIEQMRKKSTKKRIVVLNGDFFSDTQLRQIIVEFNRDTNKFGESVQVVIGTKQTKEGITLRNIRQIHVIQPEWNYADISQALARGIRVGSHKALQEYYKDSGTSIRVRVFQHVAIPLSLEEDEGDEISFGVPDFSSSIDVEQYRRSEIKDMNIKVIERALLESSWDCLINKDRNEGSVQGSRNCEYTQCKVTCFEEKPLSDTMDFSTFNPFEYSDNERRFISQNIERLFSEKNGVSTDCILDRVFEDYPNRSLVLQVLRDEFVHDNRLLKDRLGLFRYLRKWNDQVFLTDEPFDNTAYDNFYFLNNHVLEMDTSLDLLIKNTMLFRFPPVLKQLLGLFYKNPMKNGDSCISRILQFSPKVQELLVESIISLEKGQPQHLFSKFVINHYEKQKRLRRVEKNWISTIINNRARLFEYGKQIWIDNDDMEESVTVPVPVQANVPSSTIIIEGSSEFNKKYIDDNPYGFYGIVEIGKAVTKFKIRDVRDKTLVYGKNKAKVPKGELCGQSFSRKKDGLIIILFQLEYTDFDKNVTESVVQLKKLFMEKTVNTIFTKLYKKLQESREIDVSKFTENEWKTLYVLSKLKLPELCKLVQSRLAELDLIYTKTT